MADPMASSLLQRLREGAAQQRYAQIERMYRSQLEEARRVDVSAYWDGFHSDGRGRAIYRGRLYIGEVLALSSIPKGTAINLRRTPGGNFLDW